VDSALQVDLPQALEADSIGDVDQVPDLDRVAGEERQGSSRLRRPAYSPASGWIRPDSSGKKRLISGRATSSVTRPPPPSLRTPPSTIGRR
jgi:hypothetical protein